MPDDDTLVALLIRQLRGEALAADFVADCLEAGQLHPVLLDDAEFDRVAIEQFRRPPADVATVYALRRPFTFDIILRRNSRQLVSDALHEGWHFVDDFYSGYSQPKIEEWYLGGELRAGVARLGAVATWIREVRAFLVEHKFQTARRGDHAGWPVFAGIDEIIRVVEQNYDALRPDELPERWTW